MLTRIDIQNKYKYWELFYLLNISIINYVYLLTFNTTKQSHKNSERKPPHLL